jgi:hypothetical protein
MPPRKRQGCSQPGDPASDHGDLAIPQRHASAPGSARQGAAEAAAAGVPQTRRCTTRSRTARAATRLI